MDIDTGVKARSISYDPNNFCYSDEEYSEASMTKNDSKDSPHLLFNQMTIIFEADNKKEIQSESK